MSTNGHQEETVFAHYHLLAYMKVDPRRIPLQEPDRRHLITWLLQLAHDLDTHQEDVGALYGLGANGEAT